MSHFERLKSLLEDIGLRRAADEDDVKNPWSANDNDYCVTEFLDAEQKQIMIGRGDGYSGFCCVFVFDKDGGYLSHACME